MAGYYDAEKTARQVVSPSTQIDPMRVFPDFQARLGVAQEAASEAGKNLDDLRGRLGVISNYGTAQGKDTVEPDAGGEVDEMFRMIERLTDTCRDLRGLAETLNSRL